VESAEAIAGLADAPFRAARRTGNDPVSLSTLATTVGGFRVRVANAAAWLEVNRPRDGQIYRTLAEIVDRDVSSKLTASLEPDELTGAERTAGGRFDPDPEVRRAVRAWGRLARRRVRSFGMPAAVSTAIARRVISAAADSTEHG
jgi:hypothetical protein